MMAEDTKQEHLKCRRGAHSHRIYHAVVSEEMLTVRSRDYNPYLSTLDTARCQDIAGAMVAHIIFPHQARICCCRLSTPAPNHRKSSGERNHLHTVMTCSNH